MADNRWDVQQEEVTSPSACNARQTYVPLPWFRLCAHTLTVVSAVWQNGTSVCDRDQPQANQPNYLAEGHPIEDSRPGAHIEASKQQHSELCNQLQGAEITFHTILLGTGGISTLPIPWINFKN
eukprot:1138566-Pelagomonas_calceolata.AAC.1